MSDVDQITLKRDRSTKLCTTQIHRITSQFSTTITLGVPHDKINQGMLV